MKININGEFLDRRDAKISVFDHGLLYGDGIFEGIRAYNGRVFRLDEHIERLYMSARAILLSIPVTPEQMRDRVLRTCAVNRIVDGYIRLLVTRGEGDLGLNPLVCKDPTIITIASAIRLYPGEVYEKGLRIVTAPTQRNTPNGVNPAIKSLNYLNNVLARIEADHSGCNEALMLNAQGFVAECTGDNVFVVHRGRLLTPPLDAGLLHGITRGVTIELAREAGIPVEEKNLTRYDIHTAGECFLTGTGAEIVPVVEVDRRMVGEGLPGPVTRSLMAAYRQLTRTTGEPVRDPDADPGVQSG